jgi:opacity protein-like surface antigen
MCRRAIAILAFAAFIGPSVGFAQSPAIRGPGPVSVVFDGGLAAGSPGAGPAVGGRLTFDLNDRVGIEAAGSWAGRGSGADATSVTASLLVNLTNRDRKAVPYATLGGGFHRATFHMGDRRFLGMMGPQYAGTQLVPVAGMHGVGMMEGYAGSGTWTEPWSGPTWDLGQMPMFYLRRMGVMQVPSDGRWGMRTFGDPALSVGGGVRMNVTERVFVRPEARALVAFADGRSLTTGLFTVGLGYRF